MGYRARALGHAGRHAGALDVLGARAGHGDDELQRKKEKAAGRSGLDGEAKGMALVSSAPLRARSWHGQFTGVAPSGEHGDGHAITAIEHDSTLPAILRDEHGRDGVAHSG